MNKTTIKEIRLKTFSKLKGKHPVILNKMRK